MASQCKKELVLSIDALDELATLTAIEYLKQKNMSAVAERLESGYKLGFGAVWPLRSVFLWEFGMDSRKFIRFHQEMWHSKEVPHYEDAAATATLVVAIISIAVTLLSPIIGVEYEKLRSHAEKVNKGLTTQQKKEAMRLFEYLVKAYALREGYYFKKLSLRQFRVALKELEDIQFTKVPGCSHLADQIWQIFVQDRKIRFDKSMLSDFSEVFVAILGKRKSQPPLLQRRERIKPKGTRVFKGLAASEGEARGYSVIVENLADLAKVRKGDIAVFKYFSPDMVQAIKMCRGAIGLERCGGRLGHLAIVARELGVPCVVGVDDEIVLRDGWLIFVDGTKGEISL